MVGKRQAVREDLTERLLDAARTRIRDNGLTGLRTRDITNDAGCGLGTIYKCFSDLDDLILRVNSQTLCALTQKIERAIQSLDDPHHQLQAMAAAYLNFAMKNGKLWAALFDHRMSAGEALPDWHLAEHQTLLDFIASPLSQLQPSLDDDALQLRTRSVFAAVHGLIATGLEGRFISVSKKALRAELTAFVDVIVAGLEQA